MPDQPRYQEVVHHQTVQCKLLGVILLIMYTWMALYTESRLCMHRSEIKCVQELHQELLGMAQFAVRTLAA